MKYIRKLKEGKKRKRRCCMNFLLFMRQPKGSLGLKVRTSPFQGEGVGFKSRRDHGDIEDFG